MLFKCIEKDDCNKTKIETTCLTATSCYFATKRSKKSTCRSSGCFDDQLVQLYCRNSYNQTVNYNQSSILCCNHGDYCNRPPVTWYSNLNDYAFYTLVVLIIASIACLIYKKRKFKKTFKKIRQPDELSIVIEKSFYKQITLIENIGVGRFGKVFSGLYYDQLVAVKIFASNEYDSYKRELDIYKIHSLSRDSILKCIGWDTALVDFSTEYWLVLDYCKLGSLYDYLQTNVLKKDQLLSIMLSAITGLNHLHDSQEFTVTKPAICHRDLKESIFRLKANFQSKNLLMKTDRTVCIADFGLSLTSNDIHSKEYIKIQVGTKRYFSPEVLNETLNFKLFESFIRTDIYSFALVFWESLNQSEFNPTAGTFHLPYYEYTNSDPSVEEMKKVVVLDERRPRLSDEDSEVDLELKSICGIIRTCWSTNPDARFSSFQIKEKLEELYSKQ